MISSSYDKYDDGDKRRLNGIVGLKSTFLAIFIIRDNRENAQRLDRGAWGPLER